MATQVRSSHNEEKKATARVGYRRAKNRAAHVLFILATLVGILILAYLLVDISRQGWSWISFDFFTNFASRFPKMAGFKAAIAGSLWMLGLMAPLTFIVGVSTAIYLEEYSQKNWFSRLIQLNISNLAGVPSIVYGILGLTLFVRALAFGPSVLSGALTLTLLVLPVVIVAAQEAISSVPSALRHASLAMGATRWQTIQRVVIPYAMPGILTGTILALSRAIGETAPLIMVGAATFIWSTPTSFFDSFTAMPIQIYSWINQPQTDFQSLASAGIMVLLALLLSMNAVAIFLRNKFRR